MLAGTASYIAAMHFVYANTLSPIYAYTGYTYNPQSVSAVVLSWLAALAPAFLIPTGSERPSYSIYMILYIFTYIPSSMIPCYTNLIDAENILTFHVVLMLLFLLIGLVYHVPVMRVKFVKLESSYLWTFVGLASVCFYSIIVAAFGLNFNLVALDDVYEVRSEYKNSVEQTGALVSYAIQWQSCVFNLLMMGHGLASRKPLLLLAGLIGQFMIYSITGFKSVLFSGLLVAALGGMLWLSRRRYGLYIAWSAAGMILASGLVYSMTETLTLPSLTNRLLVTPGLITGQYYDFFSNHPNSMLGDSIFRWFVEYPYSMPVANVIGEHYYNSRNCSANGNLWAYGYASFGYLGLVVFSGLLALVMWLYDSLAQRCDPRISIFLAGIFALNISNGSLLTCLLTHGFLISMLIVYLYSCANYRTGPARPAANSG